MINNVLNSGLFRRGNHEMNNSELRDMRILIREDRIRGICDALKPSYQGNSDEISIMLYGIHDSMYNADDYWFHLSIDSYAFYLEESGFDVKKIMKDISKRVFKFYEDFVEENEKR